MAFCVLLEMRVYGFRLECAEESTVFHFTYFEPVHYFLKTMSTGLHAVRPEKRGSVLIPRMTEDDGGFLSKDRLKTGCAGYRRDCPRARNEYRTLCINGYEGNSSNVRDAAVIPLVSRT